MLSRNGNSFDRQFPELSVMPHHVAAETAILDGEIAVLDEQGRSRFRSDSAAHSSDERERGRASGPEDSGQAVRVRSAVLEWLRSSQYAAAAIASERLAADRDAGRSHSGFRALRGEAATRCSKRLAQMGLEGVIAKEADSKYESKRSRSWLKLKVTGQQEFVICGYTHGERDTFSSLVLGCL